MGGRQPESKSSPRRLEAEAKRAKAVELRRSGASYSRIAAELGYASESGARKAVNEALERLIAETNETTEEVRRIELERIDSMLEAIWPAATSKTHLETIAATAIEALGPDTRQVSAAIKLMERRARLLGLDAPVKNEVTGALQVSTWADLAKAAQE